MKEYKVQMRFDSRYDGKWVSAKNPWGSVLSPHPYMFYEEAVKAMCRLAARWDYDNKGHEQPAEFRIVAREVTEWEPV